MINSTIPKVMKPKVRLKLTKGYNYTNTIVQKNNLHTVCERPDVLIFMSAGTEV